MDNPQGNRDRTASLSGSISPDCDLQDFLTGERNDNEPASSSSQSGSAQLRERRRPKSPLVAKSGISQDFQRNEMRLKAKILKAKCEEQVEHFQEISSMFEELMGQLNHPEGVPSAYPSSSQLKPVPKTGKLVNKRFYARPSLLTELFEIPHFQTIHYIFIAVLLVFGLSTIVNDFMFHGTFGLDFKVLRYNFGKLSSVMVVWLFMQAFTLLGVFGALLAWSRSRFTSSRPGGVDYGFLALYIVYQITFLVIPVYYLVHLDLPPASTAIVMCEQIRFMMKSHAFVREKIPVIMRADGSSGEGVLDFSRYLYFQFVPTLVYRDNYPRTKKIRWSFVVANLANVAGAIMYAYYVFIRFCIPVFRNFNHVHVNLPTFVSSVFSCILPGSLLFVVLFFALLHCWMNAFAEMFRFADRMFYRDWWNSTNFSNYYRTWNVVVHDWLYSYIYKDLYLLWGAKYRHVATLVTFITSAIFHEYIFCCTFQFFYPVLFVMFGGIGVWLMFATQHRSSPPWNVVLWVLLMLGLGMLMCLYTIEYYARFNCPASSDNIIVDYLTPRSWTCHVVSIDNPANTTTSQ